MNPLDFEGSWLYGPKTFAEVTGRTKLWSQKRPAQGDIETQLQSCPLCGEEDDDAEHLFVSKDTWSYARCKVCGMVYQPVVPTPSALAAYYEGGGAPSDWVKFTQQHQLEVELDKRKFRWLLELAGWPGDFQAVLDVGCSTGTGLEVACEMMGDKHTVSAGVEVNSDARLVARDRLENRYGTELYSTLDQVSLPSNEPQLVILSEVLEHVLNPIELLKDVAPQKGTVIITVPNMHSMAARVLHEKAPMFGLGHLSLFAPETLRQMILQVMPDAKVKFYSMISWAKELSNHYNFKGPMAEDKPDPMHFNPTEILRTLSGYKLVAVAKMP